MSYGPCKGCGSSDVQPMVDDTAGYSWVVCQVCGRACGAKTKGKAAELWQTYHAAEKGEQGDG